MFEQWTMVMTNSISLTLVNALGLHSFGNRSIGNGVVGIGPGCDSGACNFCGELGHYIPECTEVEKYMQEGKIRKNADGRVVLSTGAFVPRYILGKWLKECVNEWYHCNPGQLIKDVANAAAVAGGAALSFMTTA